MGSLHHNSSPSSKRSAFGQAGDLLSRSSAVALTFFGTGPAFAASNPHVTEFVASAYSVELIWVASLLWFVLLAVVIYAFATLLIASLIQLGSLKSAARLFKSTH